jgi:periplasmic protein TonB
MLEYEEKKIWARAVAVSLTLHASLLVPLVIIERYTHPGNSPQRLLVELFGMIADRQAEARAPAPMETRPSPPKPAAHVRTESRAAQPAAANLRPDPEGPVAAPESSQQPFAPPGEMHSRTPNEPDSAAAPGELQQEQTLQGAEMDMDELRRYLATVQKNLQAHLVYPEEAKKGGYQGTPVVGFTITASGMIGQGSLVLVQSSGYEDLDASALRAAIASEPFDAPIRELKQVQVGVKFEMRN